jgi:murein L,D-transpeptidase YcbB/YkuD
VSGVKLVALAKEREQSREFMQSGRFNVKHRIGAIWTIALMALVVMAQPVAAQVTAFKQAVAEAASDDRDLARYYRQNGYEGLWTGTDPEDTARRKALFAAIAGAGAHGFPDSRYDAEGLLRVLRDVRSPRDLGFAEVRMSKTFLRLADDLQTGMLDKERILPDNKREIVERDRSSYLADIEIADPRAYLRGLAPRTTEYARLMKEKARLETLIASGGWGETVRADKLVPGAGGAAVIALRNRMIAKDYLARSASGTYDAELEMAVREFQEDHGLEVDGVAGPGTIDEINTGPEERLKSVLVALERERWFNRERGSRHILVNLTDFTARIIENDVEVLVTRSVVGKNSNDRRTPEFSDEMDHLVINPTWHVPRSIATKEYLPQLQRNRNAVSHLKLYDSRGRVVSRGAVNFSQYTARSFPYAIKQPPSSRNALGLVKFMFPNKYNIYLHDTPAKDLFEREVRAYSHGCIRLQQPFEFAYQLLSDQEQDPKGYFHSVLNTGRETRVNLERPVPVHIIYRTAFTSAQDKPQYRRDVYGRDAVIWSALEKAGVSLAGVQG